MGTSYIILLHVWDTTLADSGFMLAQYTWWLSSSGGPSDCHTYDPNVAERDLALVPRGVARSDMVH